MFQINFEKLCLYDAGEPGISVDVKLQLKDVSADLTAKIDTGSTACIFARIHGENLGLQIETGEPQKFSTVTGSFLTYGHFLTMIVEELEFDSLVFFAHDESFNRNVLGRNGWLDRVIIGVNDYDGKLYLKRYESE